MSRRLLLSPQADRDIDDQFTYLSDQVDLDVALRFLEAIQGAFHALLQMPEMGSRRDFRNPVLAGLRVWPIRGFQHYLIFYQPIPDGIKVVRVLHASRDIGSILTRGSHHSP